MTSTDNKHIDGAGLSHLFGLLKGKYGEPEAPYTEAEWVESDGTQYVYLDWKPPIATWGFEADFIVRNAFSTTAGAWRSDTNANGYGNIFGTRNASSVNDVQFSTYGTTGILRNGTGSYSTSGLLKTDKTRQQVSYKGTSLKRGDGTTVTWARTSETANKPYANMVVFAMHEGVRRSSTGNMQQPGTVRIYSLKFYDGDTLKVDLVGAIRNKDGMTGLYDKVKGHFYPAPRMSVGNAVGVLGEPDSVAAALSKVNPVAHIDNRAVSRMWKVEVPELDRLDDGQKLTVTFTTNVGGTTPNAVAAAGIDGFAGQWDETVTTSYSNVYLKLVLADGSETEWIPCYYAQGTRLTSHYGSAVPVLLTYRENVLYGATTTSAGTSVARAWYADPNYNTDDVYTRYSDSVIAGLNGVKRYSLCMRDVNGNWTSIMNQANNTAVSGKTAYTGGLMLGNILYHSSGSDIAAGNNTGQMKESQGGLDFRYDVNGIQNAAATELQLRKPVYLVGAIDPDDGLFYLDTTKWWTQAPSDATKAYVLVGWAYSSYYAIFLAVNNPTYLLQGGKLVEYTPGNIGGTASNVTGVVAIANGGTGQTTAENAANAIFSGLPTWTADPTDNTYFPRQDTGGTSTYGKAKFSTVWNYIKGKISSVLGLNATADNGVYQRQAGITVKTGSTAQSHISLETLMTWLITTKNYIPSGVTCSVTLGVGWNYAGNDILQLTADGINYELQLAGCIIKFDGNATGYNAGVFRLRIYSSPARSFTVTSGYTAFPFNTTAEYTCNGSNYSPTWTIIAANGVNTAGTGLTKTGQTLKHTNSVTAGTAGTSSATSGTNTLAVPYVTYDAQGHVTASGTHTHTIGNASTSAYGVTQLSSATDSTSETLAATPKAVSSALAAAKTYADGKNNQNAFSNVKVGSTTVAADTTTDTLELVGSNVTLTPDATNDKVTIGITASNVTTALGNTAVARATGDASGNAIASTYVKKSGDTMTGNLVAPAARFAKTYYGITYGRTTGTPVETILYTGIKWVSGAHMPVVHVTGYAYGLASPVEFKIAFYIYNDKIGWCGATNMGSWNPALYAFKYTRDSVNYVAIGFSGSCYFLQLQADVQDEMGAFANIDTSSTAWSWSFLTTTGTIPAADGGTTCVAVPYKADILTPNVSNVTGTVAIAHGGTGATTADAAWTALGGGAIGKKASLAASDIPSLDTSKLTSGTLGVARGGTGKATHTTNAVLTGNGTSAVNNVATASGALYATAANGAPSFGTLPIAQGGTGKTTAADAWTALGGGAIGKKASLAASDIPAHASTATTYGAASTSNYGHAKLSSATDSSSEALAATPKAVKAAYDLADSASTTAGNALSAATGALIFDWNYSISNGTITCTPHVYQSGAEVTTNYNKSCFTWSYRLGGATPSYVTLTTRDDRSAVVALTTLGLGGYVKCDFTPPSS